MNNKILVYVKYPLISQEYEIFIPINKKIKNIVNLIQKVIIDFNGNEVQAMANLNLINATTKEILDLEKKVYQTNIKQGDNLILI